MAKAKINLKPLQDKIKDLNKSVALKANQTIKEEFKKKFLNLISKGISPIEGNGRFPAYKDKKKYPGKKKQPRPVNLKLSGRFLREFNVYIKSLNILQYGFFSQDGSQYGKDLESGHREGQNNQEKRPIIPQGSEKLAKSLELLILKIYRQYVNEYLRKK